MQEKRLLSLSEMASRLGCCTRTFRTQINRDKIPFVLVGKRMKFAPERVELYLESIRKEPVKLERFRSRRGQKPVNKYAGRLGL